MKIKNRSRKGSHKFYGIGRIRTFPFSSDSAYDLVKTKLSESEAEVERQTNHNARFSGLLSRRLFLAFSPNIPFFAFLNRVASLETNQHRPVKKMFFFFYKQAQF